MEVYTKTQVKKMMLEQRKNCSKSIINKGGKTKFVKACIRAKEPDFSKFNVISKTVSKSYNIIDWTRVAQRLQKYSLTPRESEVLMYICQGISSKQLAKKLKISEKTIELHRRSIYVKLKVRNIIETINLVHYLNK